MKKFSCLIIVLISFFVGFSFCNNVARASSETIDMSMGQKRQLSVSFWDYVSIRFPDGKGKVRVSLTNIVSSGTYYVKEGYSNVEYPFRNDPNYNNLSITFVNVFLKEPIQNFSVVPGHTSVSFDVELSEGCDERLSISANFPSFGGYMLENTTFDIEIQPTDSWIPKTETVPATPESNINTNVKGKQEGNTETDEEDDDEDISDTKTEAMGKICQQSECYSNKCVIELEIKDQRRIRLYRKSSPKGKYKLIKQTKRDDVIGDMTVSDKGLKPNKQYWYKIQTLDWDSKIWSKKSPAKSYWTAPPKVKVKRSGNTLRWNKVKGAVGYMVVEYWKEKVGYNIFWQVLTDFYKKSYLTKKRMYSLKHRGEYEVYAIAKHKGFYYSNDGSSYIYKKMASFKYSERERYAG